MLTERLEQQARTDALTGLLNRAGLEEAIRLRLEGAPQQSCAIVLLDIDDFKDINDFYGHDVGRRGSAHAGELPARPFPRHGHRRPAGRRRVHGTDGGRARSRTAPAGALPPQAGAGHAARGRGSRGLQRRCGALPRGRRYIRRPLQERRRGAFDAKRAGKGRFTVYDGDDARFFAPQMLEHADYIAYAIDPETRELLFANAKMCARFPTLRPGEKCYHALMAGANAPARAATRESCLIRPRGRGCRGGGPVRRMAARRANAGALARRPRRAAVYLQAAEERAEDGERP